MNPVRKSGRLLRIAITIIILIAIAEFTIGIYHLTHRGRGSGVTEPISAFLLLAGIGLVSRAVNSVESAASISKRTYGFFVSGLAILVLLTLFAFYLGVYHLAHQGPRSATIELLSTSMLTAAIYLVLRSWDDVTRTMVLRKRARVWTRILGIVFVALILAGIAYAAVHSPA